MKKGFEPSFSWFKTQETILPTKIFHLFQLHVPVQLPCYDFIQIAIFSIN